MNYIVTDTANVKFTVNNVSLVEISNSGSLILKDSNYQILLSIQTNFWVAIAREDVLL